MSTTSSNNHRSSHHRHKRNEKPDSKRKKRAVNGLSEFDLAELNTHSIKPDIPFSGSREALAQYIKCASVECEECQEVVVPILFGTPLARGYMTKRGKFVKNWKRRYFILSGRHLTYHDNEDTLSTAPPLGIIHLKGDHEFGEEAGQHLPKSQLKVLEGKFGWFIKTDKRIWIFVCEDRIERERWLSNIRSIVRRPFARFCQSCAQYAVVNASSTYALTGTHKALVGRHASQLLFAVIVSGHVLLYASKTQHDLDRARVIAGGVLHLHGAVVLQLRRGCWQVTTPHDAVAHQFELVSPDGADNAAELRAWMEALAVEQHVPEGEHAPTTLAVRRMNPEDVNVAEVRRELYSSHGDTYSYRSKPLDSLVEKRMEAHKQGKSLSASAIDLALFSSTEPPSMRKPVEAEEKRKGRNSARRSRSRERRASRKPARNTVHGGSSGSGGEFSRIDEKLRALSGNRAEQLRNQPISPRRQSSLSPRLSARGTSDRRMERSSSQPSSPRRMSPHASSPSSLSPLASPRRPSLHSSTQTIMPKVRKPVGFADSDSDDEPADDTPSALPDFAKLSVKTTDDEQLYDDSEDSTNNVQNGHGGNVEDDDDVYDDSTIDDDPDRGDDEPSSEVYSDDRSMD